jgi:hypothetical protein
MVLHINRKSSKQEVLQGVASVSGLDRAQLIAGGQVLQICVGWGPGGEISKAPERWAGVFAGRFQP